MIIKPRKLPEEIKKLRALTQRLPIHHPKMTSITDQLKRYEAGYNGEKSLEFPLSFLQSDTLIFHNLRLHDGQRYFQIDILLLTPNLAIILEVKNYSGTVTFDGLFHQVIRKKENIEEAFSDPLLQVKRQQYQLSNWLYHHLDISMDIEALIVMANDRSVIKSTNDQPSNINKIVNRAYLPYRIHELLEKHKDKPPLPLEVISQTLLTAHQEPGQNILQRYDIAPSELLSGVACPKCNILAMKREYGKWYCPRCTFKSDTAHNQALSEYALLIASTISNREACAFLEVPSRFVVLRMLQNYESSGQGRNIKYILRED
ncbi:Nuclease-related domain-containing protein [Thalassobacillus cyri]|uniref:Nuclease-related domain-containing protein n=1 Tax=Thalassobacillus cyri TaxID=571932 RepID=A0A1H4AL49_9BACI|nr:nuclease-related domain-containing protein [Thalassobacillus cyri]SEA36394.1 Nuclease-related domain-containing protein [Thalassobacillus cyri]